jgi:catechol 2,3-dioxygenase-like lactoylglutathione lyase family enzyme
MITGEATATTTGAIPILPARDLDATSAFYARLGFRQMGRWPEYLIVARDEFELHFFLCVELDPATTIAGCYMRVRDADALHAEFAAADLPAWETGFPCLSEVEVTDYGMREFAAADPDGNLLRIGHLIEGSRPRPT